VWRFNHNCTQGWKKHCCALSWPFCIGGNVMHKSA
jgi:hypothetical protein